LGNKKIYRLFTAYLQKAQNDVANTNKSGKSHAPEATGSLPRIQWLPIAYSPPSCCVFHGSHECMAALNQRHIHWSFFRPELAEFLRLRMAILIRRCLAKFARR